MAETTPSRWQVRAMPKELVATYLREGWWTDQTLGELVAERLAARRDLTFAIHSKVRPYRGTTADVDQAARAFAGWLGARGIGPGDVVVFQLPNWVEAAIAFWGATYAGATVVPVVHFYGVKELDYVIRVAQPTVVITADAFGRLDYLQSYASLLGRGSAQWLVAGDSAQSDLPAGAIAFCTVLDSDPVSGPAPVDPDSAAIIAFTSGTTQDPKGVIHSHRSTVFEAKHLTTMGQADGPPPLVGAPVGHFMGMHSALIAGLLRDRPSHLIDVWDPAEVLRLFRTEGLALAGGSPYFMLSLLDHPDWTDDLISSMPVVGLGGAPVPPAVSERATKLGITIYRSYGSTEQPSITASVLTDPDAKRLLTDGRPMIGTEVRLDEEGQILSRGPDMCQGYTDPELTQQVFDSDGWYHTGDIGVLDDDGYLTITDRLSDVIIRGGENISAAEVENLLLGLDAIGEVGVVAAPDDRFGEHVAAIVLPKPGAEAPTLEEVRAHLAAAGLAKQKWPESIYQVAELPRTPSGKVQKFRLRQLLRDGELGAAHSSAR